MKRLVLGLTVMALVASACDSGEVELLRGKLDAARSEGAAAEEAAQLLGEELDAARSEVAAAEEAAQDSERDRKFIARQLKNLQEDLGQVERAGQGTVLSVPLVGSLSWRCNDDRDFSFSFTPEMATVTVEQSIDGEITQKTLHPRQRLTTAFLPPDVHREWTVVYRHEPGTISAGISVSPGVSRGMCFIRNSTLEQNRIPN